MGDGSDPRQIRVLGMACQALPHEARRAGWGASASASCVSAACVRAGPRPHRQATPRNAQLQAAGLLGVHEFQVPRAGSVHQDRHGMLSPDIAAVKRPDRALHCSHYICPGPIAPPPLGRALVPQYRAGGGSLDALRPQNQWPVCASRSCRSAFVRASGCQGAGARCPAQVW